jgi:hypothetical protein
MVLVLKVKFPFFEGKSKATTPSVTKSVTATPSKRGIKAKSIARGIVILV